MKYTISITKEEYDFILTAVDAYVSNLRQKMADQAQTWLIRQEGEKTVLSVKKDIRSLMDAPWGYKADGTPKKRPGRKPMRTKK